MDFATVHGDNPKALTARGFTKGSWWCFHEGRELLCCWILALATRSEFAFRLETRRRKFPASRGKCSIS